MSEKCRMKLKTIRLFVFLAILFAAVFIDAPAHVAAKIPSPNASVTKKNVMAVLKKFDTDGAFLLNETKRDMDYLVWWNDGETLASGMDTAVHEQCHSYTHSHGAWNSDRIYTGGKKSIQVPYTDVYRSSIMAKSIPKKLRTMRYDTYVGNPDPYMTSEQFGAYGLLDEFTAYNWGMNDTVSLYRYYSSFPATPELWSDYLNSGANNRLAYAEFKYYILRYLKYAKNHYPDVYKGIIKNGKFVKAYQKIEKMFAKNIKTYEKSLAKIKKLLDKNGYPTQIKNGYFYMGSYGTGLFEEDYNRLIKELKNYASIEKKLK